nr:immunoglobulin heavy chain junction region [Mus musculus]
CSREPFITAVVRGYW